MKKTIATFAMLLMSGTAYAQTSVTFNVFINSLAEATTPLASNDALYVLQGGTSKKITQSNFVNSGADFSGGKTKATGSRTARTLAARAADVFNVMDYGAVGDGITDDTEAIKGAAAAISTPGGTVLFPPGTYLISDKILLRSKTHLQGSYGASWITAAPAASWPGGQIYQGFTNISNPFVGDVDISVDGLSFTWPYFTYGGGGGYGHIMQFVGVTNVTVSNCISDGGGDFAAFIACTKTLCIGNRATYVTNAGADHWDNAANAQVIGNYFSTHPSSGAAVAAIQFTGISNSAGTANAKGFVCIGNIVEVNHNNAGQGIICNGDASVGSDNELVIANNRISLNTDNGVDAWGIVVYGRAHYGTITGNFLTGGLALGAIGVVTPATGFNVSNNTVVNWGSGGQTVITVSGANCSVSGNLGVSITGTFISVTDSTSTSFGNSTSGAIAIGGGANSLTLGGSGTWTAIGSNGAPSFTNVLPIGAQSTIQTWFTVTDSAGHIRYIPAF